MIGRTGTSTRVYARRKARAVVLQTLYAVDCTGHEYTQALGWLLDNASLPEETADFIRELVSKVLDNKDTVDEVIQRFAPAWPLQQMALVDRNILRLAVYEILFQAVPAKVAINEAVELAKSFGTDNSPKFVNGVLGSVYSELTNKRKEVK